MVRIGAYSAHTALSRHSRLFNRRYRSRSPKGSQIQSCCWEQSCSVVGHGPHSLPPSAPASASGYSFPWASPCVLHHDMSSRNVAGGSCSAFWISLTSQLPQHCCLHKGTAGNMAGRGQDSSCQQQQSFLRPVWWDHFNTNPVPQAAVQTFILLHGLHMHTHSLNRKIQQN